MKISKLFTLLQQPKSISGFTLTELMLAASLTIVVIGGAGFGVTTLLSNNKALNAKTTQQAEINRATEFIANEIRRAVNLETDAATAFAAIEGSIPNEKKGNAQAVLALDLPGVDEEVIYYVADANASWIGPKVIYRYGPSFEANGSYNTSTWKAEPLVDRINNQSLNISCPNGETPTADTGVQGFYACVGGSGKMAQIYLNGQPEPNSESYAAKIQVFTRVEDAPTLAAVPTTFTSSVLPFNISSGRIILNQSTNVTVEVLGSATQCDVSQPNIPVTTQLIVDGSPIDLTLNSGDSTTVASGQANTLEMQATATGSGEAYGCDYHVTTDSTDSTKVYALINGQDISNITTLTDSATTESFLQPYIVNGKVALQDNQVLYLFEMEASSDTNANYDLQDHAVLVTID